MPKYVVFRQGADEDAYLKQLGYKISMDEDTGQVGPRPALPVPAETIAGPVLVPLCVMLGGRQQSRGPVAKQPGLPPPAGHPREH